MKGRYDYFQINVDLQCRLYDDVQTIDVLSRRHVELGSTTVKVRREYPGRYSVEK